MMEQDWLAATDPRPMLDFLRGKASERKLRLFAVICCRHFFCDPHGGDDYADEQILSPIVSVADAPPTEANLRAIGQTAADLDDYTE
ncbi:MAG TPA: hypothetical protein VMZ71_02680, partial [Gemmataceae bacterium]|nr:hypothetical protein [Gemmataceae bacterium]